MSVLRIFIPLLLGAAIFAGAKAADAQTSFPQRPVRAIVGGAAGSSSDLLARALAPDMAKVLGQPVIVENKPGAGFLIAMAYVAKEAPADGHTFFLGNFITNVIARLTVKDLSFDPLKDLEPISRVADSMLVLVTPRKAFKSFDDLTNYAKANPGKLNYGSISITTRLLFEAMFLKRNATAVEITYRDSGGLATGLLSGEVSAGIMAVGQYMGLQDDLVAVATTSASRSPLLPDVPPFVELGVPEIVDIGVTFQQVRPGTPTAAIEKLTAAMAYAISQPSTRENLQRAGLSPISGPQEPIDKAVSAQIKVFSELAQKLRIEPK